MGCETFVVADKKETAAAKKALKVQLKAEHREAMKHRYPKRSVERKNYRELEIRDEDERLCKLLAQLYMYLKYFCELATVYLLHS
jgi:hypothetical protein